MKKYISTYTRVRTANDLFDFSYDMCKSISDLMRYVTYLVGLQDEVDGIDISELYVANENLYDAADDVYVKLLEIQDKID